MAPSQEDCEIHHSWPILASIRRRESCSTWDGNKWRGENKEAVSVCKFNSLQLSRVATEFQVTVHHNVGLQ